ncbi:MAG: calcium-binding protein, partial [Herbaspirillum sp.]
NSGDRVVEKAGEGIDTVYATASTTLADNVENLVLIDATKPQSAVINGVNVLVYGMPKSYQLDYAQGDAVPGFLGTCGETVVANMSVLAGRPLTEKEVVTRAIDEMLCDVIDPLPEHRGGTYTEGQQALLKDFGIDATITHGFDEMAVARSIKEGKAVGLSVNASRLWDMPSFTDARQDNLWFSKTGQDLRIKVLGTTDQVTVKDWYAGAAGTTDNHIERIKTADGKSLLDTDVDKLVQAMASFAPPAATQTTWAQAQGGDGKVLLAVSH